MLSRFRNMGEKVDDKSEVGKPVPKGKDRLVIKNHCFEV